VRPIVTIVGPTAAGKTAVGVAVACAIGGEIVSADSMAVYRGMDIGTAKPTVDERAGIGFHCLDLVDPDADFNVSQFKRAAVAAIESIESRGKHPLLVGGTGLYVRVVLEDFGLTETARDPDIRARLEQAAEIEGTVALHERLTQVDPVSAARIHANDRVRIVRALEVFEAAGKPLSELQREDAERRTPRPSIRFGLTAPREELNRRIDRRVDAMIESGLVLEVKSLIERGYGPDLPPLQSLGYKEIAAHICGELTLDGAVEEIKQNTRRFAKRQLTWFRADRDLIWVDIYGKSVPEISREIVMRLPI
jgi:tRNA dimethylallyltransferase